MSGIDSRWIIAARLCERLNDQVDPPFQGAPFIALPARPELARLSEPQFGFQFHSGDHATVAAPMGELWVAAPDPQTLLIGGVAVHKDRVPPSILHVGREIVRRVALTAHEMGLRYVMTSQFKPGAASFWFGLGFAPLGEVKPDWRAIATSPNASYWEEEVASGDPLALCAFARTPEGEKALGRLEIAASALDLTDARQMRYAEKRLRLPQGALG